jgi:hypothetical protein
LTLAHRIADPHRMAIRISKTMWTDAMLTATHQALISGLPINLADGERAFVYDEHALGEPVTGELRLNDRGGIDLVPAPDQKAIDAWAGDLDRALRSLKVGEPNPARRRMHVNGRLDDELAQKERIAADLRVSVAAVARIINGFRESEPQ